MNQVLAVFQVVKHGISTVGTEHFAFGNNALHVIKGPARAERGLHLVTPGAEAPGQVDSNLVVMHLSRLTI